MKMKRGEDGVSSECKGGGNGSPPKKPVHNGIVRYDSHMRNSGVRPRRESDPFRLVYYPPPSTTLHPRIPADFPRGRAGSSLDRQPFALPPGGTTLHAAPSLQEHTSFSSEPVAGCNCEPVIAVDVIAVAGGWLLMAALNADVRYTQRDDSTACQLRVLRVAPMVHLIRVAVSPLSPPLFWASNASRDRSHAMVMRLHRSCGVRYAVSRPGRGREIRAAPVGATGVVSFVVKKKKNNLPRSAVATHTKNNTLVPLKVERLLGAVSDTYKWSRGDVVDRPLASHLGEPGSTVGFSHLGIMPDDAACRWVFSGISRFPSHCIPALLHTYLTSSALKSLTLELPSCLHFTPLCTKYHVVRRGGVTLVSFRRGGVILVKHDGVTCQLSGVVVSYLSSMMVSLVSSRRGGVILVKHDGVTCQLSGVVVSHLSVSGVVVSYLSNMMVSLHDGVTCQLSGVVVAYLSSMMVSLVSSRRGGVILVKHDGVTCQLSGVVVSHLSVSGVVVSYLSSMMVSLHDGVTCQLSGVVVSHLSVSGVVVSYLSSMMVSLVSCQAWWCDTCQAWWCHVYCLVTSVCEMRGSETEKPCLPRRLVAVAAGVSNDRVEVLCVGGRQLPFQLQQHHKVCQHAVEQL
ncbi:hypothetical protein PR048_024246 [Dryococelus australis]|uniref:Uncharacterized protein n=1 Tax=Dryococelus australis TaxID=614101 RepID=A0ABQ9GN33_9NEOP|nr:hypothetical protein PR048_024246 [Dryococelus australis]